MILIWNQILDDFDEFKYSKYKLIYMYMYIRQIWQNCIYNWASIQTLFVTSAVERLTVSYIWKFADVQSKLVWMPVTADLTSNEKCIVTVRWWFCDFSDLENLHSALILISNHLENSDFDFELESFFKAWF